jgi:4-hydroxy-L-threonine phosphate dehydrogenase PdxA
MKIAVTQGHEKGIGLEVFFKSCLLLGKKSQDLILFATKEAVAETLHSLHLPYQIEKNSIEIAGISIGVHWLKRAGKESFQSLKKAMEYCEKNKAILFTLPTSKDQFPNNPGHTEYFRAQFKNPDLGMFFSSPDLNVLLITDHLSIKSLSDTLTEELIYARIAQAAKILKSWKWPIKKILVSGLNPHAGEGGLIGNEDERIKMAINRLRVEEDLDVSGPFPGDTMYLEKRSPHDLLVYLFHDQGLGVFKGLQGFIGSNITLGLPYPRFSPDHGTSFSLFGKNQADYRGCAYSLNEALSLRENLQHGKNPGHQGQGSQPKKHRR